MIRIFKKLLCILEKKQKKSFVRLFFVMLIGAFLEVLGVGLMLPLMSAIMDEHVIENYKYVGVIYNLLGLNSHMQLILVCVCLLIVAYILKDSFIIFQTKLQADVVFKARINTQYRLLDTYFNRPYEFFLSVGSADILRTIQDDVLHSFNIMSQYIGAATELIVSMVLIIACFYVSPEITATIAIVLSIVMLFIMKTIKPVMQKAGKENRESYANTNKWVLQAISGIKEIKVSCREEFFKKEFRIYGEKSIITEKKNFIWQNIPRLMLEMSSVCSVLIAIAIMVICGKEIASLLPALSAFVMAAVRILPATNRITGAYNEILFMEPMLDRLVEALSYKKNDSNAEKQNKAINNSFDLQYKQGIELKNIFFKYETGDKYILEMANMQIPIGSSVGIIGQSGAGKTTAIDVLLGLLKPQGGMVLVDGVNIEDNYNKWLSYVGYIPQMIYMLDDSIRTNIVFGGADLGDDAVWDALKEAKLDDFVRSLPKGLDTQIGERGVRLSGGQRQRIGIARALYNKPQVLVLDEATSALDNETEASIMESIELLRGKITLIIIAHRLTTIEKCDIVYRVESGKIVQVEKEY